MSKLTKLLNSPDLFFIDAYKNIFTKNRNKSVKNSSIKNSSSEDALLRYISCIKQFKDNFPVNDIKINQDEFWPFLKAELIIQASLASKRKTRDPIDFNPYLSQMCSSNNISPDMIEYYRRNNHFKMIEDIKEEKTDFLFFVGLNSIELIERDDKLYHRLTDPIMEVAETIGTVKKIEIIKVSGSAIHRREKYYHQTIPILPPIIQTTGYSNYFHYPKRFLDFFKTSFPFLIMNEGLLNDFVNWQMNMVMFYENILKKYNPKVIFFFPFAYNTPLIFAANRLGIKTVEIQHGVMSGNNTVTYDNWQEIPKNGYMAFPQYFWVWGNFEYQRMNKVLRTDYQNFHKPIIGGYPWLKKMDTKGNDLKDKIAKKISLHEKKSKNQYKNISLITLQTQSSLPKHVIELIEKTNDSTLWLIRKHPKGKVPNFLQTLKSDNFLYDNEINTIPLNNMMEIVDLHFTACSTSVLEADYFGVYNYVFCISGYKNYKEYIDNNKIGYFREDNIDQIIYEVKNYDSSKYTPKLEYISDVDIKSVLKELLQ